MQSRQCLPSTIDRKCMTMPEIFDPKIYKKLSSDVRAELEAEFEAWLEADTFREEVVQEGMTNFNVNAPRPPTCGLRVWADIWKISVNHAIWRIYIPHVPYTPAMTMEECIKIWPYSSYLQEQADRKICDYETKVRRHVAECGAKVFDAECAGNGDAPSPAVIAKLGAECREIGAAF